MRNRRHACNPYGLPFWWAEDAKASAYKYKHEDCPGGKFKAPIPICVHCGTLWGKHSEPKGNFGDPRPWATK